MRNRIFATATAMLFAVAAQAAPTTEAPAPGAPDKAQDDYLIARQGKAEVWAIDVDAHLASMPENNRAGFIDSPKRIQQLLGHLLLRRNLALEAKELGLDQDPVTQRELLQAAEVVLMRRRFDHIRKTTEVPDLEQLAKEKFLANREAYKSKETVTVVHILLDTDERSEDEAVAQLQQWKTEIAAGKADIEALAKEHSDDPGVSGNHGVYADYDPANFVPEFAAAISRLAQPGDLSEPVKTEFGYHLIQLRERKPGHPYAWEEVKDQLVAFESEAFLRKVQADHIEKLKNLPVDASEESVMPLRERYGQVGASPAAAEALDTPDATAPDIAPDASAPKPD